MKKIVMEINLKSTDKSVDDLIEAEKYSDDTYCPVWSMLKGNLELEQSSSPPRQQTLAGRGSHRPRKSILFFRIRRTLVTSCPKV
jgi:hypothetical protein